MAYIVDADLLAGKADGEPLEFDRQATVFQLAVAGHGQCAKAWREFRKHDPGAAKFVEAEVVKTGKRSQKPKRSRSLGKSAGKVQSREALLADGPTTLTHRCEPRLRRPWPS